MAGIGETFGGFSGMKFRLLLMAAFLVVGGMLWNVARDTGNPKVVPGSSVQGTMGEEWVKGRKNFEKVADRVDPWGDAAVRLGACFIVAMIFGSLTRVFLKTMVTFSIAIVAALIVLDYKGIVDPGWSDYFSSFSEMKHTVVAQTESLRAFVKGHFPPAASAFVGFGFGLKR